MCYSRAEGGQRCFGHARIALSKARATIERDPSDENYEKYRKAEIEYASTTQGAQAILERVNELRTQIDSAEGDAQRQSLRDSSEALEDLLARGAMLRHRNAAVRTAGRPSLTEANDRDMYTTVAPDPVPDAKSEHMAAFKADLDNRFADMRGARADVAVRQAGRAIADEQARHDLLHDARLDQTASETPGDPAPIHGVPLGGAAAIAPSQGFAVARTIAMRTFGGRVSKEQIEQNLARYAADTPLNPVSTVARQEAQFTARIERYLSREQAAAASRSSLATTDLLNKVGSGPHAPNECARAVDHLIAATTEKQAQAAAQRMYQLMREGSKGTSAKDAAEQTADLVHRLTGRKAYVRTGALAALRGVEGSLRYLD